MNRFAPALRRTARELDLPRSVRAEILLEMAADLEAAYEHHLRLGATEKQAEQRAEAAILGSTEVLRRLGRLHRSSWRSWSEEIGSRLGEGSGLVLLVAGVGPILLLAGLVAGRVLTTSPGPLLWILLAVGAAIGGLAAVESGRIIAGGRSGLGRLPLLLILSVVAPALGMLALVGGVHAAATALSSGIADGSAQIDLLVRVGRDAALFAVGLLLGIAGSLSWFALVNRVSVTATREVDALLMEGTSPVEAYGSDGIIPLVRRRRG